jgi:hypothetical protein
LQFKVGCSAIIELICALLLLGTGTEDCANPKPQLTTALKPNILIVTALSLAAEQGEPMAVFAAEMLSLLELGLFLHFGDREAPPSRSRLSKVCYLRFHFYVPHRLISHVWRSILPGCAPPGTKNLGFNVWPFLFLATGRFVPYFSVPDVAAMLAPQIGPGRRAG